MDNENWTGGRSEEESMEEPEQHWTSQSELLSLRISKLRKVIFLFIALAIVSGIGFLGFGFYNGLQVKAYAKRGEDVLNKAEEWEKLREGWNSLLLLSQSTNSSEFRKKADAAKSDLDTVDIESEKSLVELNRVKAPRKSKELESELKEYLTIARKDNSDFIAILKWIIELDDIGKVFNNLQNIDTSSYNSFVKALEEAENDFERNSKRLKSMEVPKVIEEQHKALKNYLGQLSDIISNMVSAIRSNNQAQAESSIGEFKSILNNIGAIRFPDSKEILGAYKKDKDRLNELEEKIKVDADSLKSVGVFVF